MNNLLRFRPNFNVNDWPLTLKLTTAVLGLLIAAIAIVTTVVLVVLQDNIARQIGNNLNTLAESTAGSVSTEIANIVDELRDFARSRTLINDILDINASYDNDPALALEQLRTRDVEWRAANPGDPVILALQNRATSSDLRIFVNADPNHSEVIATDRQGGLVAITVVPNKFDQTTEQWWAGAFNNGEGGVYISQPFFDRAASVYTITVAVPIFRPNSTEVIGVLRTNYRLRNIVNELTSIQVGETGEIYLLTDDGLRLDTTAGGDIKVNRSVWRDVVETTNANYYTGTFESRESLVASAPILGGDSLLRLNELGWHIAISQDLEESLAAQRSAVIFGAVSAAIVLVILMVISINTARGLVRPIAELTRTARQAQGGNLFATAMVFGQDEVGQLAQAFNQMIGEIRTFTGSLEKQVLQRTKQLAAVNEIAAAVAGSLNLAEVMSKAVNLIRDRLGYYHVSIFLLDERGQNAVVRESTGDVGRLLKERGHSLAVGSQSIIGYVTASRRPRIALDTGADAVHFKNPLLPTTRSEIALPLVIGDQLFGALDVQSTTTNAFAEEDVAVLQNMANQIAIAINNARLFQETQARLEEISTLNRQYVARAWDAFSADKPDSVNLQLERGLVTPAPKLSVRQQPINITAPQMSEDGTSILIPVVLRDEVIGELALSAPEGETRWDADDLALVDAVVGQVALAVENARLLEETQSALGEANRLARRERIISDISNKIAFGADVQRILQIAADELRRATGSSRAVVRLNAQQPQEVA